MLRTTPELDLGVVDELLSTTRAVRRQLDLARPVDPGVILECLQVATQAPTGGNLQGWRWLVVTDPAVRAGLADLYRKGDGGRLRRRAERNRISDPSTARVFDSAAYLADVLERVPVHVVPCIGGRVEDKTHFEVATVFGSILPAVWSFMLALRSRGLGSTLTTVHLVYEQEAADLLGVPDDHTQVALIPVAHVLKDVFKPAPRAPLGDIVFQDGWGRSFQGPVTE